MLHFPRSCGSFCSSARAEAPENGQLPVHTSAARITSRSAPACSGRALRTGAALPGHQQQRNHDSSLTFRTRPGSRRNLRELACYAESQRAGTAAQPVERASAEAFLLGVHNYVRHRNFLGHKQKRSQPQLNAWGVIRLRKLMDVFCDRLGACAIQTSGSRVSGGGRQRDFNVSSLHHALVCWRFADVLAFRRKWSQPTCRNR